MNISFDEQKAELDNVIVNKYGVFIIEVKNYVGRMYGNENDYEWQKYKTTESGETYQKTVQNPIYQEKRQTGILGRYLRWYGCDVWVDGRALLVNGNSPVDSLYMLKYVEDIDSLIHTFGRNRLDAKTVEKICDLLKPE